MPKKNQKILVAMSGGVDSSVVAALLVRQGYDVTSAFMRQWSDTHDLSGVCAWKKDRRDALRVAAYLGIPLVTLNFEKEYKKWVMNYMFAEYKLGRTPNPDVLCNKFIKFGVWLKAAKKMGYDKLATGHYANIKVLKPQYQIRQLADRYGAQHKNIKTYFLMEARDKDKDQTYFLHQLSREQLKHILFPIGDYKKTEVRKLAKKFNLPTVNKAESMGICFVGEVPMKEFLAQKIKTKKGKVTLTSGEIIGEHDGLAYYTIGQRHIKINPKSLKKENQKPLYVVGKKMKTNELVVGYGDDILLYKKEVEVADVNWIADKPNFPLKCKVRLRHRQSLQSVQISEKNGKILMSFANPQRAVTPGQFAVFYLRGECLGGGVIEG